LMYPIQTLDLCNHQMKVQYCFPYHEDERLHNNWILSHYKFCFVFNVTSLSTWAFAIHFLMENQNLMLKV
jgi:hypothetical protein